MLSATGDLCACGTEACRLQCRLHLRQPPPPSSLLLRCGCHRSRRGCSQLLAGRRVVSHQAIHSPEVQGRHQGQQHGCRVGEGQLRGLGEWNVTQQLHRVVPAVTVWGLRVCRVCSRQQQEAQIRRTGPHGNQQEHDCRLGCAAAAEAAALRGQRPSTPAGQQASRRWGSHGRACCRTGGDLRGAAACGRHTLASGALAAMRWVLTGPAGQGTQVGWGLTEVGWNSNGAGGTYLKAAALVAMKEQFQLC